MSRKDRIYSSLSTHLNPNILIVEDESHQHRGTRIESHFKVILVSTHFNTLKTLERHRCIHQLLQEELANGLHALSLSLYTLEEWEKRGENAPKTPPCQHSWPT